MNIIAKKNFKVRVNIIGQKKSKDWGEEEESARIQKEWLEKKRKPN